MLLRPTHAWSRPTRRWFQRASGNQVSPSVLVEAVSQVHGLVDAGGATETTSRPTGVGATLQVRRTLPSS